MLGIYSLMIWTICHKLISFYRNAVSLYIIFVVRHGEIFIVIWVIRVRWQSTKWRCRWGIGEYGVILMLIGIDTIALKVQRFAADANIIGLTYATDWWAVIGPVIHGESKSQATRESEQLGPFGSTSLASCQHVGRFCVRVCSLFVWNWRAKIMMSNPWLSNKFDVDLLSNSDSQKVQ